MTDPLAKFRKQPLTPSDTPRSLKTSEPYIAFDAKDNVDRLIIRRSMNPTRSPRYLYLKDIAYDAEFGTNFALYFEFMVVVVRGRNLQPVILALQKNAAEFIYEFDPDRWEMPTDEKAPFIHSIEVLEQEDNPPGAENRREIPAPSKPH
jgi:hypothetical protein